jgi:NhaP-type Na+/H+ or K+/H+ antiporter
MSKVSLLFVEQLERLTEVALLLLVGGMLFADSWQPAYIATGILLVFVVRPVSVYFGLIGNSAHFATKAMIGWFGVRGIGSFYYLMYAIQHGLEPPLAMTLVSVVLVVVALSIFLHGITVTPLMRLYSKRK